MRPSPQKVTAFIPVRGGSKGLPNKNKADLGGHPLMAWPIMLAKLTPRVDKIVVSTDDPSLKEIANHYGADVIDRPQQLASDHIGLYDVIIDYRDHFLQASHIQQAMILLEATSPFRSLDMIQTCIEKLDRGYQSVATFKPAHSHPQQCWKINDENITTYIDGANPWVRRQQLPPAYELSGELYGFHLDLLDKKSESLLVGDTYPIIIDSHKSVDINRQHDLDQARQLFHLSPLALLGDKK